MRSRVAERCDWSGASRTGNYYALEYYKQLVPNAEVTLPGSTCATCDPKELSPANTWTPQNLAALVERLGGAIVVTHSQSGIMGHHMARILKERGHLDLLEGAADARGSCSLTEQRAHGGRLRQHPVHGAQGRLHGDQHGVPGDGGRDQRAPRRQAGHGEGRVPEARRHGDPRRDPHDDARQEEPRDRRHHAGLGEQERPRQQRRR